MSEEIMNIKSISQLHHIMGLPKPAHPLISVIDAALTKVPENRVGTKLIKDFYMISLKDRSCGLEYGRNSFDFDEGVMIFTAPGQVYTATREIHPGDIQGWMLYFHPDLIRNTNLGAQIHEYSFFSYDVYEALHLSEKEEKTINDCISNIRDEYEERIDNHSQRVLVSNVELLLNYCLRFYERQFNTRTNQSKDIVSFFERELKQYFSVRNTWKMDYPRLNTLLKKRIFLNIILAI